MPIEALITLVVGLISITLYLMRSSRLLEQGRKFRQLSPEAREELAKQDPTWEERYGKTVEGWRRVVLIIASALGLAAYAGAFAMGWL